MFKKEPELVKLARLFVYQKQVLEALEKTSDGIRMEIIHLEQRIEGLAKEKSDNMTQLESLKESIIQVMSS